MQMNESQIVPASQDKVWAGLNDPAVLAKCIPGCQKLELTAPNEMTAAVVVKVGPVKANFAGKVTLSDIDAPNGYRISGEGSGGVAGFAKGGATVKLTAEGPDQTRLEYAVDAQIGGKLAQLGSRLIDSTAKKLAGDFFEKFAAELSPPAPEAPAEPPAAEETPAPEAEKKGWFKKLIS
jgi:carbon monoxide dehydrogenase subunit G